MAKKQFRLELHQHTCFSPDSPIQAQDLAAAYRAGRFDLVAITDHDTINGALYLQQLQLFPLIVGEEIKSAEGDVLGFFLQEAVPAGLPLRKTLQLVKEQGGVTCIPHPLQIFGLGIGEKNLLNNLDLIDLVELHNGAGPLVNRIRKLKKLLSRYQLIGVAASDAHYPGEIGRCVTLVEAEKKEDLMSPRGFLQALQNPEYDLNYYSPLFNLVNRLRYNYQRKIRRHYL